MTRERRKYEWRNESAEGAEARQHRWRHNQCLGQIRMAAMCAGNAAYSPTMTEQAAEILVRAEALLRSAYAIVYSSRRELDGTEVPVGHKKERDDGKA